MAPFKGMQAGKVVSIGIATSLRCSFPIPIPFGMECQIDRPDTIIQEDKAPAHASRHQQIYFDVAGLQRLLWSGNSPDLGMIELARAHLERGKDQRRS